MPKVKVSVIVFIVVLILFLPRITEYFNHSKTITIAYYYIWYSQESDWDGKVKALPQLGSYKSSDPNIVKQHIYWAKSAGINCFAISYWGDRDSRSTACLDVTQTLAEQSFKFCLMLEGDSEDFDSTLLVSKELDIINSQFTNKPNYLKTDDNKPILIVFDVPSKVDFWREVKTLHPEFSYWLSLKLTSQEPMAFSITNLVEVFDLIDVYCPLAYGLGLSSFVGVLSEQTVTAGLEAYFTQKSQWNLQTKYSSTTICLQFDNTAWANIYHDRAPVSFSYSDNIASLYKSELRRDYVFITSFNEFYEHTQVEPSVADGYKILNAVQSLLQ